jgi:hypothetical protein
MGETQLNRQILLSEGPWTGEDLWIALEQYFQTEGLSTHARCQHEGPDAAGVSQPLSPGCPKLDQNRRVGSYVVSAQNVGNSLTPETDEQWWEIMDFLTRSGVFKTALKRDGQVVIVEENGNECRRRLRGRLTLRELKK